MTRSGSFGRRPERPAPARGLKPPGEDAAAPDRRRLLAGTLTAAAHLLVFGALYLRLAAPPVPPAKPPSLPPLQVSFVALPKPAGPSVARQTEPAPHIALPRPPSARAPILTIAARPAAGTSDLLSESEIAGAASTGEGGGGGGCDMARAVQQALRRDPLVRAAVADAGRLGKASMLWNGDWVRSGAQEGKGLAAVRQAVIWEVGFAPEPCRNAPMRGLVLVSLADGSTRFAIGASMWRWSDLLGVRAARHAPG